MSNLIRSVLVVSAVLAGASAASAATTSFDGIVNGGSSQPVGTRAFFDQLQRNGN